MDERVGRLQKRGRIRECEIESSLFRLGLSGDDVRDVNGNDARDTGVLFETGEHPPPDGSGRAGDHHRAPFCEGLGAREGVGHHPPTMPP